MAEFSSEANDWPQSTRLLFRMANPTDEQALLQGMDWSVASNLAGAKWPYTDQDARLFIAGSNEDHSLGICHEYVLVDKSTDEFVGVASLSLSVKDELPGQIGYWISQRMRGRGFATEALRALIAFAKRSHLSLVWAVARADNHASIHLLQKNGFTLVRRQSGIYEGTDMPEVVYELIIGAEPTQPA